MKSNNVPDEKDETVVENRQVTFILPEGMRLGTELRAGETVLEASRRLSIRLRASCGGKGRCKTCQVIRDGESLRACQEYRGGDYTVPKSSLFQEITQIDAGSELAADSGGAPGVQVLEIEVPRPEFGVGDPSDIKRFKESLAAAGASEVEIPFQEYRFISDLLSEDNKLTVTLLHSEKHSYIVGTGRNTEDTPVYAASIDVGTSTVVAELFDAASGKSLGKASTRNGQAILGEDVASRITAAETRSRDLQYLIVQETIAPLLNELCASAGIECDRVAAVVISGNSVMTHLLLGWPVEGFGRIPFNGVSLSPPVCDAFKIGLMIAPSGKILCVPGISAYVGGDLTSGVTLTGLDSVERTLALVDIGTNCEIIVSHQGQLYGCSTPAGPAFEGEGISSGTRARRGAIEKLWFEDGHLRYHTIGDQPPVGLCGSALLDVLGRGHLNSVLNPRGRLAPEGAGIEEVTGENGRKSRRLVIAGAGESADGYAEISISEKEIASLMQAKAAVYAGIETLLAAIGIGFADIEEIYLAGGFARYVDLESAVACGILPKGPKLTIVGNTSLTGAGNVIRNRETIRRMHDVTKRIKVIELNLQPGFEDRYIDALFLPE